MDTIDWKYFATTPGYKSLKAAYIHDLRKKWRSKKELLKHFRWVIDRAKHYAHKTNISIEFILNKWEAKRDYWWLNYYQDCKQPKIHSNSKKPTNLNGIRKYYKKFYQHYSDTLRAKYAVNKRIQEEQQKASTKKKKRWITGYKKSKYR